MTLPAASEAPLPPEAPGTAPAVQESAAYPPALRCMAVLITAALAGLAIWSLPALKTVSWSFASLATYGLAAIMIGWVTWWMVFSRTRLEGDELTQTWLWDKRVHARDVTTFKIIHWTSLQHLIAPRLMVRRRNGGISWFHAEDASLLKAFALQVVAQGMRPEPPPAH